MASRDRNNRATQVNRELSTEQVIKRLDMLDARLDNIDSVVTSLVERVMKKPLTMEIACPKCGQVIQILITSNARLKG